MAQAVVDELEVVEVQEKHGQRPQIPLMQLEGVGEPVAEERPVGQAGQPVVKCLMQQLFFTPGERCGEVGIVAQHQMLAQQHHHDDGRGAGQLVDVQQMAAGGQREGDGKGSGHGCVVEQRSPAAEPARVRRRPVLDPPLAGDRRQCEQHEGCHPAEVDRTAAVTGHGREVGEQAVRQHQRGAAGSYQAERDLVSGRARKRHHDEHQDQQVTDRVRERHPEREAAARGMAGNGGQHRLP